MLFVRLILIVGVVFASAPAVAQSAEPLNLEDVIRLLDGNVAESRIVGLAEDRCINFEVDQNAVQRLKAAGATDRLVEDLLGVCSTAADGVTDERAEEAEPGAVQLADGRFDSGMAAMQSALIPGWGQFSTRRAGPGFIFGAAAVGAVFLHEFTPDGEEMFFAEGADRPYRWHAVGTYVAAAFVASIDAYFGAERHNRRVSLAAGDGPVVTLQPRLGLGRETVSIQLGHVSF